MNEPLSLITAFLLGFMGSVHCMGMCGGIVGALSLNARAKDIQANPANIIQTSRSVSTSRFAIQLSYHLGRIITYGMLGLAAGYAGLWLASSHENVGLLLRSLSGFMLVLMGFYLFGVTQSLQWIERIGGRIWQRIQPFSKNLIPVHSTRQGLLLGFVWGFLPCGLVYSTLSWALVSASPINSAALMMMFGLGTMPALFSFSMFTEQLNQFKQQIIVRSLLALSIVLFGLWTLITPWW